MAISRKEEKIFDYWNLLVLRKHHLSLRRMYTFDEVKNLLKFNQHRHFVLNNEVMNSPLVWELCRE